MDVRNRFLLSLCFLCIMFSLFTIFIVVNTDTWQTMFFIITMTLFGISSCFHPFYGMTNVAYLSKFPTFYMELNILGTAISGLFSTILQIVSLTVGHTSTQIAMIYFCSGLVIVIFTLFLIYIMKYSATIQYYLENGKEEGSNQIYTLKEYWEVAKKIWFILLIIFINSGTMNSGHPNITNLVVSEGYTGTGQSLWNDKYFVVVATYLLFDIFQIIGRLCGRTVLKKKTAIYFILFALFRSFVLTPLLWFCNAQPRSHLPVLFPHDYQYMIILAIHSFTGSAFLAICFLSIPFIAEEKTEQALILGMGVSTISLTITSPLSPVYVNLL
ncbi:unnamed protein product [Psylliodes chrysocephalus]|uniref:Uncharacterized protein n=1 Tax=Psylliodes chrysocephalus TaxID=3402493 RepID=A0A9P0CJQ1_9CUCU|nr:unnamed protein product [Psylliodes chrysocephala]